MALQNGGIVPHHYMVSQFRFRTFLERLIVTKLVKKSMLSWNLNSLPCPQEIDIVPNLEADESSSSHPLSLKSILIFFHRYVGLTSNIFP
jgi:hypothetical protein